MFLVFMEATGFGLDFDHHSGPFHLKLFRTRNVVITFVCYYMGSQSHFCIKIHDNKILKCYEIVKF